MSFFDLFRIKSIKEENERLKQRHEQLGFTTYDQTETALKKLQDEISVLTSEKNSLKNKIEVLNEDYLKTEKKLNSAINKINKSKELYKSIDYTLNEFHAGKALAKTEEYLLKEIEELSPSIILKLHCIDIKDLRKVFKENDKQIDTLLKSYESRYTTKANQTIYKLMVIALRAELQNVLYGLKYEKLDHAIEQVKTITSKYLNIVKDGNQQIAGTITKFIGELEYLFINAVKIEYNYYVKKEQARQEQLAIREQMKQEAEERKKLEIEKKKVEAEESKYYNEIEKAKNALQSSNDEEKEALNKKILELERQLAEVAIKKEEIINLQNGKAGNIYVISNLGAFGNKMFKIGMTRRRDPQERVDELGDASVPFKFDVHCFIFSEDAVSLENKLHTILNENRVNKVNLRKEFFYSTIDELEKIVLDIDPTAEFVRTMAAEEYFQSLSSDENYTSSLSLEEFDEID